jgi:hypothetical protein
MKRQGSGKPPNTKAVSNDKAKANARPSQTATVRGKPSGPGMGCLLTERDPMQKFGVCGAALLLPGMNTRPQSPNRDL